MLTTSSAVATDVLDDSSRFYNSLMLLRYYGILRLPLQSRKLGFMSGVAIENNTRYLLIRPNVKNLNYI